MKYRKAYKSFIRKKSVRSVTVEIIDGVGCRENISSLMDLKYSTII